MSLYKHDWQPEHDDKLMASWGKKSTTAIALEIGHGLTKNAVIGRALRLGLPRLRLSDVQKYRPRKDPRIRNKTLRSRPTRPKMVENLTLDDMRLIPIVDLKDTTCHWPIGDPAEESFRYCGLPKSPWDGPYCPHHHAKSYEKPNGGKPSGLRYIGWK